MKIKLRSAALYQLACLSLLCVMLINAFGAQVVSALDAEQKALYQKGILYFDAAAACVTGPVQSVETANNELYALGDSLMVGAYYTTEKLKDALDSNHWQSTVNASVGRSITNGGSDPGNDRPGAEKSGLDSIEVDSAAIRKAGTIVIELGTNTSGSASQFGDQIKDVIKKIREINEVAKIYWVNIVSKGNSVYDNYNDQIKNLSSSQNYEVIDAESKGIALSSDKLHPTDDGYAEYSKAISEAVGDPPKSSGTPKINLSEIVTKYDLHSAIITKINGDVIAQYKSNSKPSSPASTMKVIIAEVALRNKIDLSKRVTATDDVLYSSAGVDQVIQRGQTVTLRNAIEAMLSKSSNVGANMLIKELGGVREFSEKAKEAGYKNTTVHSIYHDPPGATPNESTIADQAKAMSNIQTAKESRYEPAKRALGIAAKDDNQYDLDSYKNKWGGTSSVASNVGAYKIGSGKYIIGTYHLGDHYQSDEARYSMHDGTKAIIDEIENPSAAPSGSADAEDEEVACCIDSSGTTLPGKDNAEKIWNYLVTEMGFSNTQAAGIMGNIDQESGFDTDAENPRTKAYGIAQWYAGRLTGPQGLIPYAQSKGKPKNDLGVQLEFLKKELEGSYYKPRVTDPIKASDNLSEIVRIWLEKFEIPCLPGTAACDEEMNIRMPKAQKWVDGSGSGGSAAPSGCSEGGGTPTGELAWPLDKQWPVTSCYGYARRDPATGKPRLHTGIDIGAARGTPIKAADGGTVTLARDSDPGGFGKAVMIKHTNKLWTLYAHLLTLDVSVGDQVNQGDVIGTINNTGSSQGDHLHFNVQTDGGEGVGSKDPLDYLPKDGRGISGGDCPPSLDP